MNMAQQQMGLSIEFYIQSQSTEPITKYKFKEIQDNTGSEKNSPNLKR